MSPMTDDIRRVASERMVSILRRLGVADVDADALARAEAELARFIVDDRTAGSADVEIVPEYLRDLTFVVQHSPNCNRRYLVRLPGGAAIDLQPYDTVGCVGTTKDVLGFGQTLEEAARIAVEASDRRRSERLRKPHGSGRGREAHRATAAGTA